MQKACFITKTTSTPTKMLKKAFNCVSFSELKRAHEVSKEEAMNYFKEKAVGDGLEPF